MMNTYLSNSLHIENDYNSDSKKIRLKIYEITERIVTGYRVYCGGDQVVTLEYSNEKWVAGVLIDFSIQVMTFTDLERACHCN